MVTSSHLVQLRKLRKKPPKELGKTKRLSRNELLMKWKKMILLRKKPLKESGKIKRFRGNKILMKRRKMMLVRKRLLRRKEMIP